ncbi:MAG: hypothetical protein V2A73_20230, partial [Pseudomonadota bacterium]
PAGPLLDKTFERLEFVVERARGYHNSLQRDLARGFEVDEGPLLSIDQRLAGYQADAHFWNDMFENKLAFVVLLNFPLTSLAERLSEGESWSRRQWAETRLAQIFATRVPAAIRKATKLAETKAEDYISGYNIRLGHVLAADGRRLFPDGLKLIAHWGLRDELKARYQDPDGLPKQRLIQQVFERIVTQQIPRVVIDNPLLDWVPATGKVAVAPASGSSDRSSDENDESGDRTGGQSEAKQEPSADRELDTRYARWLEVFAAHRAFDRFDPQYGNFVARTFEGQREIPVDEVRRLLVAVLEAPQGKEVARMIAAQLRRPLEPFDLWYPGFKPNRRMERAALDELVRKRYPTAQAFTSDLPNLLGRLGFSKEKAAFLAERIEVDPSRGAGHAYPVLRRDDKVRLRTRVADGGIDYKGFNIAIHELGHNVEEVFSTITIDHITLAGVPNDAFTEAIAFLLQARDLELLGKSKHEQPGTSGTSGTPGKRCAVADESWFSEVLDQFWTTREIAGHALVDLEVWSWLYANPDATAEALRRAVMQIAGDIWRRYYADLLGASGAFLLASYSHHIQYPLYLANYFVGHLVAFQMNAYFRKLAGPPAEEIERMTRLGWLTPQAWMRQAIAQPLSPTPLLEATSQAILACCKGLRPAGRNPHLQSS